MTSPAGLRTAALVAAFALSTAVLDTVQPATGADSRPARGAPSAAVTISRPELPRGGFQLFPRYFLVAYYGTAHTPAMGVLGEGSPARMTRRLRQAARPFRASGKKVQIVYELIVSIADAHPGPDGNYSHFIPRAYVERFVALARRNRALLVLDLQPGRQSFAPQASRFRWALREPFVGLALDPEWRMGPHQVPARSIGSVRAGEINRVSRFVASVTRANHLPQKVFMVHQFRREMVRNIEDVKRRDGLAMIQHIDGFGSRRAKLATFHHVAEPSQFSLGFKLFYDEDTDMFAPRDVLRIRPRIRYVSYQ
ncbi:MAG: hypothetical protein ABJA81_10370 [Nocardioidaceae bacterium]